MSDVRDSSAPEHLPPNFIEPGGVKSSTETETAPLAVSAGSLLRQAREAAGLHIASLAVLLKVPVKRLEALEADRFDLLPDAVFARALASSVCRNLKIDPTAVLEKLPQTSYANMAYQSRGINTPFRGSDDRVESSLWAQVSRPAVLAGLVLLLGALVLVLLPAFKAGMDGKSLDLLPDGVNAQPSVSSTIGMAAGTSSAAISEPQPSALSASASSSAAISPVPLPGFPITPASSLSSSTPAAIQSVPVPASAASVVPSTVPTGIVVFTAKSASWVQVTDAKGVVVLRRTLAPDEVVGATGALPLSATVGRADAIQVQIRGNAFDLSAVAKNNVARFEVK